MNHKQQKHDSIESCFNTIPYSLYVRLEALGHQQRETELDRVRHDVRHNAHQKRRAERGSLAGACVHVHEPRRAEDIAYHVAEGEQQPALHLSLQQPVERAAEDEADDISAGGAGYGGDTALEPREHRQPDHTHEHIHHDRGKAALAAEEQQRRENGKGLHGERDGHGNAQP